MINGYLASAVWIILAGYLLFIAIRRSRTPILFILSGFMTFLAVWELIDTLSELNMKQGTYGWIYRGVGIIVLILCAIWFFMSRRRN